MLCILCLKIPKQSISIFGDHGLRLNVKTTIRKHFWIQPNEDDMNQKLICSTCWTALESFHIFYGKVKEAHCTLSEVKVDTEDIFEEEERFASSHCGLIDTDTLNPGIKTESNDGFNIKISESESGQVECDQRDLYEDEDFESDIPLSKLIKQVNDGSKKPKTNSSAKPIDNDIENDEPTNSESNNSRNSDEITDEGKIHIHEGKWLATCFGEETTAKPIRQEELDKFIKLNFELTCEMCRIPMNDFSALQAHFKDAHTVKPFVTCCDKKFQLRSRLVDHILLHKLPNYFSCVICSRVLSCRLNLRKHMVVHDKKRTYQCDKCDKSFYRKEALNNHMLDVHTLDRKFKCDECDKLFASKCSLNTHIYGVHRGRYKKICEQCGKVSCDQETFLRHLMKHSNQPKPVFQCPKCNVKLSSKHGLRHHVKHLHSEDTREHVCNVCGTTSSTESALKRHIIFMHEYKRDYKCTLCDKAFKRALSLKEHMTTHTGEVLYTCPHCPKTFNSNANMHSHRKKMHRKEWEENRRHPHMGATTNATEENNQ